MCGIVGISSGTEFDFNKIEEATERMSHRGPDDHGHLIDEDLGIAIGHRRLAIMDTSSSGHQPMYDAKKRVAIVFNGEIYNFPQLRKELEAKGYVFHGRSDTEVILNLYLEKGEEMLSLLNGIFAFAIWDKNLRKLFLARDALGVKPLYYSKIGDRFVFASEIKSIMHLLDDPGPLDYSAIDNYLSYLWCPGEGTPLKFVRKLSPGNALWVSEAKIERNWSWYQLPVFNNKVSTRAKKSSVIETTCDHLRTAVRRQLVADVPVGAFLSGGLDSSSVVAFAREENPDIRCFTIEFINSDNEGMVDDLPYAKRVAKHLNVPLDIVRLDPVHMAEDLPDMVSYLDEPLADPASLNVLYISRLARQNGIKVLLSGAGGDDLFTGYRRHRALSLERYWKWLPDASLSFLESTAENLNTTNPLLRRFRKLFNGATLKGDNRLVNYFRWINRSDLFALYTSDFRLELSSSVSEEPMIDFLSNLPSETEDLERLLALEQRFFLTDHNLIYTDKMSMAEGVEVRVPFLDLDLVEFASQIPSYYKQRGREGKWILKKAMEPYLPRDVIYRSKTGFGAPLRRWLKVELKDWLAETLSPKNLNNRGFFEPQAVQRLINDNESGRIDASYTLFSLACIEMWCKNFLDKPVAQDSVQ
jgi:asparagine synthase (glutamine-hydrolysing)